VVLGQQLGVAPSVLEISEGETGEAILYNQNNFRVNFSVTGEHYTITPKNGVISPFGEKRILVQGEKPIDDLLTISFIGGHQDGLALLPALSVRVVAKDSNAYLVSSSIREIPKRKRNLGPAIIFMVVALGLVGYFSLRIRLGLQRNRLQSKPQKS